MSKNHVKKLFCHKFILSKNFFFHLITSISRLIQSDCSATNKPIPDLKHPRSPEPASDDGFIQRDGTDRAHRALPVALDLAGGEGPGRLPETRSQPLQLLVLPVSMDQGVPALGHETATFQIQE